MNLLKLIVRRPGNLFQKVLETDISEMQYAQIVLLLSDPDRYVITERPPIGFRHPADPRSEITTNKAVSKHLIEGIRRHQ